jgi:hypothetical protein
MNENEVRQQKPAFVKNEDKLRKYENNIVLKELGVN